MTFQPIRIVEILREHDVDFIIIGGIAAAAHGAPTPTLDIDICYERSLVNLKRLAGALRALGARLRGVDEDVPFLLEPETLKAGDHFTLETDLGDFDLLGTPAGTNGYEDLVVGAVALVLGDTEVKVASIDDLIRMKKAAGRPQDQTHLDVLSVLREEAE